MPINPQDGELLAGVAGKYAETITPEIENLLTGDYPQVFTTDETIASGQTIAALTVVGFNGSGEIVPASATVSAVGILVYAADTTGGAASGSVYRSGVFNPDRLGWDAHFATDELKRKAFEGAPSPTQIVVRAINTFTPV